MRRSLIALLGALTLCLNVQAATLDSLLVAMTNKYLLAIDAMTVGDACKEVDFMIGAVQDSVLRSEVAVLSYKHFRESKMMGSENVAVHIYDKWFASFRAVFPQIEDLDEAEMYAWVNRRSLIGAKAPRIKLIDVQGDTLCVPGCTPLRKGKCQAASKCPSHKKSRCTCKKRFTVLYFYSTKCPKCLYTSLKLKELFNGANYPKSLRADIVTVYTGEDEAAWQSYISRELALNPGANVTGNTPTGTTGPPSSTSNTSATSTTSNTSTAKPRACSRRIKVCHLRGAADGDYPLAYGVVQTPRLFLIDPEGIIIGRSLDAAALKTLLERIN